MAIRIPTIRYCINHGQQVPQGEPQCLTGFDFKQACEPRLMRLVPADEKLYQLQCRQRTHGTPDIYGRMIQHTCKCFVEVADGRQSNP